MMVKFDYLLFKKIVENNLYQNMVHDFSVWLRIGLNPEKIKGFRAIMKKKLLHFLPVVILLGS